MTRMQRMDTEERSVVIHGTRPIRVPVVHQLFFPEVWGSALPGLGGTFLLGSPERFLQYALQDLACPAFR